jgi:flagellar biosynthetic protein FliR
MAEFTAGIVRAGSAMMLFMLKLVAPLLAAFLLLSAILGILARALPEMNVLMTSLPLRVALGFLIASAMMPMLNAFAGELAAWMAQYLLS